MNPAQHRDLEKCLDLMAKSKKIARHEPLADQAKHHVFLGYTQKMIQKISAQEIEGWEFHYHLWALTKTLNDRIRAIQTLQLRTGK